MKKVLLLAIAFSTIAQASELREQLRSRYMLSQPGQPKQLDRYQIVKDLGCCCIFCASSAGQLYTCPVACISPIVCSMSAMGSGENSFGGCMNDIAAPAIAATVCLGCIQSMALSCFGSSKPKVD